jgi:DNA adenine methylase
MSALHSEIDTNSSLSRREFCAALLASCATVLVPSIVDAKPRYPTQAKPFVKWAGGKGQLLEQLNVLLPNYFATSEDLTYVEPFVGGGAMLFFILSTYPNIKKAVINDLNSDLITTYLVIKSNVNELIEQLQKMQEAYYALESEQEKKEYYLAQRAQYNAKTNDEIKTAALFIFLNRTGFNGLYRVNSKGQYNVPFGKADKPKICDTETLLADHALLQKVEILNGDFADVLGHIEGKAFFYFDPPYRPLPKTASFTAYSKDGFGDDQQRRLAEMCRQIDAAGNQWLQSNSDPHNTDPEDMFFEELYEGFDINRVTATRMINSKAEGRGRITELTIRNYNE